jgi:type II secretory pathway pseudopilin PulG
MMKQEKGLILIELIMTIVLIGIIASFTGFFIYSGINGYLRAKEITNAALDAQRSLDRISLELRYIDYFTAWPVLHTSLEYTSTELTTASTRRLLFNPSNPSNNMILIGTLNNEQPLLEHVEPGTFNLRVWYKDLDQDGTADDVAYIDVGFNIENIGTDFATRIFPRNMVERYTP